MEYKGKTTEEYWKDRYKLSESLGERTEQETLTHLKVFYKNAMLEINKEIEAFYGRYADDNGLTIHEVRKNLNPRELKAAKDEIAKYYRDVDRLAKDANGEISTKLLQKYKKELRLQSAKAYMSRLEDLKARIKNSIVKLGVNEDAQIHDLLLKTSENAYTKSSFELSKVIGFANTYSDLQFEKLIKERWLGANYSERVWNNKGKLADELEKTFLQRVVRGQNPNKIAGALHETLESSINEDFVKSYYACERLAKTETIHALNESTFQSYKDYGVKRYQFVCGLDEKTCPTCGDLDRKDFALNEKVEGINFPVLHSQCRCGTIPFFEKDDIDAMFEEATRAAYDEPHKMKEVSASMTYKEWKETFKKQKEV